MPCLQIIICMFTGQQTPQTINSPGPRLVLLFKAGSKSASGFKAQYRFETGKIDMVLIVTTGHCYQSIRYPGPRDLGCATSRTGAPADWRGGSTPPATPRTIPMISIAPTCSSQHPVSRSYQSSKGNQEIIFCLQVQIVFDHFKIRADNINTNSSLGNWKAYG